MNDFRGTYSLSGGVVRYRLQPIEGADRETFEPLDETWSRDGAHVYKAGAVFPNADPATFAVLSRMFAKDKDHVFVEGVVAEDADAATFEALRPEREVEDGQHYREYARDAARVFYKVLAVGKLAHMRGADAATFRSAGGGYGLDASTVFHETNRLVKADPATWRRLGPAYSRDDARIYSGNTTLAGVHAATFATLPGKWPTWARDKRQFYFGGKPAQAADYWSALRGLTILVGTVVGGDVLDQQRRPVRPDVPYFREIEGCRLTVRCDECLFAASGHEGVVPRAGDTFDLTRFDPLAPTRPATWIGRTWIWFCEKQGDPGKLVPTSSWRTFWPIERRAETEALIEELRRQAV